MKKLLAITLALILLLALFTGCKKEVPVSPPATSSTPESSTPETSAAPASPESTTSSKQTIHTGSGVGFYSDDADWFGRPAYKFAYVCYSWTILNELFGQAFEEWGKRLNYEFTSYDSGQDMNAFFAACESYAGTGYDGLFVDADTVVSHRVIEHCEELGIYYMPVLQPLVDNDTRDYLAPAVNLDSYYMGEIQSQWFVDNYRTYWPDVDPDEIAFLYIFGSNNENWRLSLEGSMEIYKAAYPDLIDTNFIAGDMVGYEMSAQAGLEYCSAVITSHPEFKYWYITSVDQDRGQGGVRAAEDLNIESNVLVLTTGVDWLIQDWDNGYEGCWIGGVHFGVNIWAEPMACGLIALIEGRATYETLWGTEFIPAGQKYPCYAVPTKVVTKDTYKAYLKELEDYLS